MRGIHVSTRRLPKTILTVVLLMAACVVVVLTGRREATSYIESEQFVGELRLVRDVVDCPVDHLPDAFARREVMSEQECMWSTGSKATSHPPLASPDIIQIHGRVVTKSGSPIEGADVYAWVPMDLTGLALHLVDPGANRTGRGVVATDRDGRFEIQTCRANLVCIAIRAPGYAPLEREIAITDVDISIGDLGLERGAILSGHVITSDGRPVAGARIENVTRAACVDHPDKTPGSQLAITDNNGAFRTGEVNSGAWTLLITHDGYPDLLQRGVSDGPGCAQEGLVFRLEAPATIEGRIVGAPASALADLHVRAVQVSRGDQLPRYSLGMESSKRVTDCLANGAFRLSGLQRSLEYQVSAFEGSGYSARRRSEIKNVCAGDQEVVLQFLPETSLTFQVVNSATDAPIDRLAIDLGYGLRGPLLDEDGQPQVEFPDGRVRIDPVPLASQSERFSNDTYSTRIQGLGLQIGCSGYRSIELEDISLTEGEDNDLGVILLDPLPKITVRVLDLASRIPIPGALITLDASQSFPIGQGHRIAISSENADRASTLGLAQRATTGADGSACLSIVSETSVCLVVQHPNYAPYRRETIEMSSRDHTEQVVLLSLGGSVTIQVVNRQGRPGSGVQVEHRVLRQDVGEQPTSTQEGPTREDGLLELAHLQVGIHQFRVAQSPPASAVGVGSENVFLQRESRWGSSAEPGWVSVNVEEGLDQEVRLVIPSHGSLTGHVAESEQALSDALVRLLPKGTSELQIQRVPGQREARTDRSGTYAINDIEEGEYRLEIEHASRSMAYCVDTHIVEGDNVLDVTLPVTSVEGQVTGEDGKPIMGARVWVESVPAPGEVHPRVTAFSIMVISTGSAEPEVMIGPQPGSSSRVLTDSDGRYSIRGPRPDEYLVINADATDSQPARSEVFRLVSDHGKRNVDLKLERGGEIEVVVTDSNGIRTRGGLMIQALSNDCDWCEPKFQVIGLDGRTQLSGLKPGIWHLTLDHLEGTFQSTEANALPMSDISVQAGRVATVTMEEPRPPS